MKTQFSLSTDASWARAVDPTRHLVLLRDGTWVSEEFLTRLDPAALEAIKQAQRGNSMDLIGLDFETYGSVNLPKHGLDRYTSDTHFRPLLACTYVPHGTGIGTAFTYDFVADYGRARNDLQFLLLSADRIAAHNVPFEKAVLDWLGIDIPLERFIDSAVVARAAGGGSSLEAAAPQLLGVDKMPEGRDLIKLFSIPGKYQEKYGSPRFYHDVVKEHPDEWATFIEYCQLDAELSYRIAHDYGGWITPQERQFTEITVRMGQLGWPVDVASVEEMQRRFLENQDVALQQFREDCDAAELNLNSLPQLKAWCADRGIRTSSFDEKNVDRLLTRIEAKLDKMLTSDPKFDGYAEVRRLLATKQILGGSALKKLQVILDTVGADGRLRDQYVHCGAGQTLRTTGRSVQMQNLPRLAGEPREMDELHDAATEWSNTELAQNLRQVFTSSHPQGRLIVGDFSSVESRGLAWLAGEQWKLEAYRKGLDLYKLQAEKIFGVEYAHVTKPQRQVGKVGELGCGYAAGGEAVQNFAETMGVPMSVEDASQLVYDWRSSNPAIVGFWDQLNLMLHQIVTGGRASSGHMLADGFHLTLDTVVTPRSLDRQHAGTKSVALRVWTPGNDLFLQRVFHGCYLRGRNVAYYKPSDRKTGDLWKAHYVDPKTKRTRFYELYGGKLAGILTQSFCRELFFRSLREVQTWADYYPNLQVVGQFHDEIVVDWQPGTGTGYDAAEQEMTRLMSDPGIVTSFPLAAEVHSDYRYIK